MKSIDESLAGRTAILEMLPFHPTAPISANASSTHRSCTEATRAWPAALSGLPDRAAVDKAQNSGALIETCVVNDLHAWRSQTADATLSFWRAHGDGEANVLIERRGELVTIEIKVGPRIEAVPLTCILGV
jgi:hypothetical protein